MAATVIMLVALTAPLQTPRTYLKPVIDGEFWPIAGNPDLGKYTSENQQPVDFAVWQAADGTWQLWSCIRHTKCGGNTRLFYRWEGANLTDRDWKPMGIAMEARPEFGEHVGGLQAPHVVRYKGLYWMAYGDWEHICFATSRDGKEFIRAIRANGETGVFNAGPGRQSRDPMLIDIDGIWHCYYTGTSPDGRQGYTYCSMSPDMDKWSPTLVVCHGGQIGTSRWQNECPHVVEIQPGQFTLFRNQYYGENSRNWVYHSTNPLNFGIDDNTNLIASLEVAAPEIIRHEGQYYIASLNLGLDGIRLAKLEWQRMQRPGRPVFDFTDTQQRGKWKTVKGDLGEILMSREQWTLNAPMPWFITTAAREGDRTDDRPAGTIESPAFKVEDAAYTVYISGGYNADTCCVMLVDDGDRELARFTGLNSNHMLEARWVPAPDQVGRTAHVRIVDDSRTDWGHVNFGGIYRDVPWKHEHRGG